MKWYIYMKISQCLKVKSWNQINLLERKSWIEFWICFLLKWIDRLKLKSELGNCRSVLIDWNWNRTKWSPKGEQFWIFWKSELIDCLRNLMKVRSLRKTNFCLKFYWFSFKFGLSTQLGRRHCENNVPNWTLYSGKRLWHGNTLLNLAKQLLSHGAYPFLKFGFSLGISLFVAKLRKVRGFVIL